MRCDRVTVLWSEPERGARSVVGLLERVGDGFRFRYADQLPEGFTLIPEFPERTKLYQSRYLFSTFAQRIPSQQRPDRAALMEAWGVEDPDDQLEVLARSGGVQMTDRIEISEYRDANDDLSRPLHFRIAGEKYYAGSNLVQKGEEVELALEPDNLHDKDATKVLLRRADQTIGYVPRQYAPLIAGLLRKGARLEAIAERRLTLPPERDRWVVRVSRSRI